MNYNGIEKHEIEGYIIYYHLVEKGEVNHDSALIFVEGVSCIRVACVAFWGKIRHKIFKYDGFKSMKKARDINGLLIFQAFPV